MNRVILVGNLARDPELTTTNSGLSVCRFTVAVSRSYANADGEREADFINCVAWRNTAEFVTKYFKKGSPVGVVGSIQARSQEGQDGTKKYVTEVSVDNVEFVGRRNNGSDDGEPVEKSKFDDEPKASSNASKIAKFEPIDDDDLPF